ncbi:HypE protein [Colletotrichum abscissum]|uniref:HypE protein n=3 Tax=Colletotrichum acutatum species complex TaxID=2707335 RepID=A0A9Q0B013_9PEZI|nr:HypE protein [Colletotrichum tamarilloi]XP_060400603.1 HypE protein [Colletotrichum abscissum]KAK1467104.1 HypE protein [Colletotrichum melonis]KAI3536152.1 HypE protein [Colletotrichum abscissum]KAK1490448.1 HypE protein [Colletotrichum tamarilloi]KAK1503575.1 HypE protein [Colletotrichum abscissum]
MDYRLVLFLYRKKDITHAEFRDHYEYIHIPLTRELTGSRFPSLHSRRYIERSPKDEPTVLIGKSTGEEPDAVVEIGFKNEEAAQAFFDVTNSGEVEERLRKDNAQFLDWERLKIMRIGDVFETRRED